MKSVLSGTVLRIANIVGFIFTAIMNWLGSTGKLSSTKQTVGEVSDTFNTRITPAGYAFSIWGVIYFLIAVFVIWAILPGQKSNDLVDNAIGWRFLSSCLLNVVWIIVWTQAKEWTTWLASLILFGLLANLMWILIRCQSWGCKRSTAVEFLSIDITFSVYAGWVTAASIVNVAAALVGSGWTGSPWTGEGWSALIAVVAAGIYLFVLYKRKDVAYALVYCWAFLAVILNNKDSVAIVVTDAVLIGVIGVASGIVLYKRIRGHESFSQIA